MLCEFFHKELELHLAQWYFFIAGSVCGDFRGAFNKYAKTCFMHY